MRTREMMGIVVMLQEHVDTPEVVRVKVAEAAPYKVLKVKMGLDNDKELVEIIRDCRPEA